MSIGTVNNFSDITYKIIRRNRKTISIKITDKAEVIVTSPFYVSEETIDIIVKKKEKWIMNRIKRLSKCEYSYKDRSFNDGEKFLYLGRYLELKIFNARDDRCITKIQNNKIQVYINFHILNKEEVIKESILNFYKDKAKDMLKERTAFYSGLIGVIPKRIFIKAQKTIWGSCSCRGNINYNYRLIMAPINIIDYIVVHELCHILHMNHSKDYWNTVKNVMPDYKDRREWLKINGWMLKI